MVDNKALMHISKPQPSKLPLKAQVRLTNLLKQQQVHS